MSHPFFNTRGVAPWDEAYDISGHVRPIYQHAVNHFQSLGLAGAEHMQHSADLSMLNQGVTFTVYSDARGTEKIFPFDLMPRIISDREWTGIEAGVVQRMVALNLFLDDIYHEQKILKDGIVPCAQVMMSTLFCREMSGLDTPGNIHVHIGGIDLIRNESGSFHVLEDNLRCPSGVSYVVENRWVMGRTLRWPPCFEQLSIVAKV